MSHFDILNEIILAIAMYMYFSMIDQADISASYSYIYIVESGIKHHKPLIHYSYINLVTEIGRSFSAVGYNLRIFFSGSYSSRPLIRPPVMQWAYKKCVLTWEVQFSSI